MGAYWSYGELCPGTSGHCAQRMFVKSRPGEDVCVGQLRLFDCAARVASCGVVRGGLLDNQLSQFCLTQSHTTPLSLLRENMCAHAVCM